MAGSGVARRFAALVTLRIAKPIRLGIQQRVQCLLHTAPNDTVEVVLNPFIVNRDDIAQGDGVVSIMAAPFLTTWCFAEVFPMLKTTAMAEAKFGCQSRGTTRQQISSKMTSVIRGKRDKTTLSSARFKGSNDQSDSAYYRMINSQITNKQISGY